MPRQRCLVPDHKTSQFIGGRAPDGSHWLKIKVLSGLHSSLWLWPPICFLTLSGFEKPPACLGSWPSFFIFKAESSLPSLSCPLPVLFHFQGSHDYIGPTQIIQSNLPVLKSAFGNRNSACNINSHCHGTTHSWVPGIRIWTSLWNSLLCLSHIYSNY